MKILLALVGLLAATSASPACRRGDVNIVDLLDPDDYFVLALPVLISDLFAAPVDEAAERKKCEDYERRERITSCANKSMPVSDGILRCRMFSDPSAGQHCSLIPCRWGQTALSREEIFHELWRCCAWKEDEKKEVKPPRAPEQVKEEGMKAVIQCADERASSLLGLDLCTAFPDGTRLVCQHRQCQDEESPLPFKLIKRDHLHCCRYYYSKYNDLDADVDEIERFEAKYEQEEERRILKYCALGRLKAQNATESLCPKYPDATGMKRNCQYRTCEKDETAPIYDKREDDAIYCCIAYHDMKKTVPEQ